MFSEEVLVRNPGVSGKGVLICNQSVGLCEFCYESVTNGILHADDVP